LVVARAARVQLARDGARFLAEHALDDRVDVLLGRVGQAFLLDAGGDAAEPRDDRVALLRAQDAGGTERARPGDAPPDVFRPEATIDSEAEVERRHLRRQTALEAAAPKRPAAGLPAGYSAPASITSSMSFETIASGSAADCTATAARIGRPKSRMKPAASAWSYVAAWPKLARSCR